MTSAAAWPSGGADARSLCVHGCAAVAVADSEDVALVPGVGEQGKVPPS